MNEVTLTGWQVAGGVALLLLCVAVGMWGFCREQKRGLEWQWQLISDSCYARGLMRGRMELLERITALGHTALSRRLLQELQLRGNGRREWGAVVTALREARELMQSAERTLSVEDYGDSLAGAIQRLSRLLAVLEEPRCEQGELTTEQALHLMGLALEGENRSDRADRADVKEDAL